MKEGDALAAQAAHESDLQRSLPLYDQAIDRYRKSLALHRPANADMVERQMWNLETGKHDRMVRTYWAEGQALEKAMRLFEALAAFDKAIASFHPTVPENNRMWAITQAQDLRNRINAAKNWRADGEAKQAAGKIAEAVASYRQSLKLVPDPKLEQHIQMLERQLENARLAQAQAIEQAHRLRAEGEGLQKQNRLPEAIGKYRDSLKLLPDPKLEQHIQTLERQLELQRQNIAQAQRLRAQGEAFQRQNQIREAITAYRESLRYVPDPRLEQHVQALERSLQTAAVPVPAPVLPPRTEGRSYTSQPIPVAPVAGFPGGMVWRFGRADGSVIAARITLLPGGRIQGYSNPNEHHWGLENGKVVFYNASNQATTRFLTNKQEGDVTVLRGAFLPDPTTTHILFEVGRVNPEVVTGGTTGTWEYFGIGDCPGNDIAGGSQGMAPDPRVCDVQHTGLAAVCWDSSTPRAMSPPACTVKSVRAENCTGGVNPGRMYRCRP